MAAALYNKLTGTNDATSAGTEPVIGRPIHETVLQILKDHELASDGLFRKKITEEMFNDATRVYSMTDRSIPSYMNDNSKVVYWDDVPDPKDLGIDVHKDVYRIIEKKVKALVATHD